MSTTALFKNTTANLISGLFIQGLSILSGVFIARWFGPEGFGQISFAGVVVSYFLLGTDFGMSTLAIRQVAQDKARYGTYLLTYLAGKAGLSVLAFCGLIALVMTSKYTHDVSSLVLVQGGLLLSTVMSVNWIFVAYQRMELQSACEMAEKFLYVVFLFGAFLFYRNLLVIPWAMVVASLLAGCAGWVLLRRELPARRWGFDRGFFRELLLKSWPVGLSNAASRINTNLDTIFIQIYWGGELTGHYNAAYRIIGTVAMFGTFFTSALYPLICERSIGGADRLDDTLRGSTRLLLLVFVPSAVILTVSGPEVLTLIFGARYEGGATALRILAWVPVMLLLSRLYGNTLTALHKQESFMAVMVISAGINIALNFALIPGYALTGAALATLATELFILVAALCIMGRSFRLGLLRPLAGILAAGVPAAAAMVGVRRSSPVLALLVSVPVYVLSACLIGAITREEILRFVSMARSRLSRLFRVPQTPSTRSTPGEHGRE